MGKFCGRLDNSTGGDTVYLLLQEEDAFSVRSFTRWQRANDQQAVGGFSHRTALNGANREMALTNPKYPDCSDLWAEFDLNESGCVINLKMD